MTSYFDTFHAVASFFLSKLHEKLPSFFSIISVLINTLSVSQSFTKSLKPTQTIRRQIGGELFECV